MDFKFYETAKPFPSFILGLSAASFAVSVLGFFLSFAALCRQTGPDPKLQPYRCWVNYDRDDTIYVIADSVDSAQRVWDRIAFFPRAPRSGVLWEVRHVEVATWPEYQDYLELPLSMKSRLDQRGTSRDALQ